MVLLNCSTDGVTITPTYRKPFDLIFQRAKNEEWSGREDLNLRPPGHEIGGWRGGPSFRSVSESVVGENPNAIATESTLGDVGKSISETVGDHITSSIVMDTA